MHFCKLDIPKNMKVESNSSLLIQINQFRKHKTYGHVPLKTKVDPEDDIFYDKKLKE